MAPKVVKNGAFQTAFVRDQQLLYTGQMTNLKAETEVISVKGQSDSFECFWQSRERLKCEQMLKLLTNSPFSLASYTVALLTSPHSGIFEDLRTYPWEPIASAVESYKFAAESKFGRVIWEIDPVSARLLSIERNRSFDQPHLLQIFQLPTLRSSDWLVGLSKDQPLRQVDVLTFTNCEIEP